MKKIIVVILAAVVIFAQSLAYALESSFLEIRDRIFEESKAVKSVFTINKDIVIISSIWDTCMVSIYQLDAYFYMVQLYNTINPKQVTKAAANCLVQWLSEVRKANEMSLNMLGDSSVQVEPQTMIHIENMKRLLEELNGKIDRELKTLRTLISLLKK